MASWNFFTVYNSKSSSILSNIILNVVNFADGESRSRDSGFGTGFSVLDQNEVWCLLSPATKPLILKLKVKNLNHLCAFQRVHFHNHNVLINAKQIFLFLFTMFIGISAHPRKLPCVLLTTYIKHTKYPNKQPPK